MRKIILLIILFLFSCYSYEVINKKGIDESKVVKLKVPIRQERGSGFHDEEDISFICAPKEIVFIKFANNMPQEVWCEK